MEPPPFQEAARCDVCKCRFTTFRRLTLSQFGTNSPVRVCADFFSNFSQYGDHIAKPSINGADQVADSVARLDIGPETVPSVEPVVQGNPKCKCEMPLCICEAPGPSTDSLMLQGKDGPVSSQPSTKPKKVETVAKTRPSNSSNRSSPMLNSGEAVNGTSGKPKMNYDVNGEVLQEAIKNDYTAAVKKLLGEAAVFNRTDIAFILIDHDASLDYRNAESFYFTWPITAALVIALTV